MKRLQKTLHPDKFSTKSETERSHSADQAGGLLRTSTRPTLNLLLLLCVSV